MNSSPALEMTIYQHIRDADETKVALIITAAEQGIPPPRFPRGNKSSKVAAAVRLRFAGMTSVQAQAITRLNGSMMRRVNKHIHEHTAPTPCVDCGDHPGRIAGLCAWCLDAAARRDEL